MGERMAALLAARGVRPRKVSAKRSWPPGCGRFPPASVVDKVGAEEAGVFSAACNGSPPAAPLKPGLERVVDDDERREGGEAQPSGDNGQVQSKEAIDVIPIYPAPQSCVVAAAGSDSLGNGPDLLRSEGDGCQGSPQLFREKEVPGDGVGTEMDGSSADVEFESKLEGVVPQAPPQAELERVVKDRSEGEQALSPGHTQRQSKVHAIDVMPLAFARPLSCAVAAENGQDGPDLLLTKEKAKESAQLVGKEKVPDDGDGRETTGRVADGELHRNEDGGRKKRRLISGLYPPPKRRAVSAIRTFPPGCGRVAGSRCDELLDQATEEEGVKVEGASKAQSDVRVKPKGNRFESDKMNEVLLDDAGVSREGKMRNKASSTQRGIAHPNINKKQDVFDRKLKRDGKSKGTFNISAKKSKGGHHVMISEMRKNNEWEVETGNVIVQALMAPDQCPWTQGRKSVGSVSQSKKKKDAISRNLKTAVVGNDIFNGSAARPQIQNLSVTGHIGQNDHLVPVTESKIDVLSPKLKSAEVGEGEDTLNRSVIEPKNEDLVMASHSGQDDDLVPVSGSQIDVLSPELKSAEVGKDTLNRSAKKPKTVNHVVTGHIGKKDDLGSVSKSKIVQALMAPANCPWTRGRKSIARTPRTKTKKKDAAPRK